jgi:histidinol phosphatase-like PHP family hydrolase
MNFVSLHTHTGWGSPFDGLDTPKEMVDAAIAKGMNTLAITEHGNLNSLGDFILYVDQINKDRKSNNQEPFKAIYGM